MSNNDMGRYIRTPQAIMLEKVARCCPESLNVRLIKLCFLILENDSHSILWGGSLHERSLAFLYTFRSEGFCENDPTSIVYHDRRPAASSIS
jgi:hypothetical protein